MSMKSVLAELKRFGIGARSESPTPVSGGSISRAYRVETSDRPIFLKVEPRADADRLEAEADGLAAIANTSAIAVPAVLAVGAAGAHAFLALEWIELAGERAGAEASLGEALARMHRTTGAAFGWTRDNTIGRTPQPNSWMSGWIEFFREQRLMPQLDRARRNGIGQQAITLGHELAGGIEAFFDGYAPAPSLLHGDLWGGNWGASAEGRPYLFDPAVYFGDREADLAMTQLFGGFGNAFYRAYDAAWPPAPGREQRVDLYNLYHLLNHFNLFGGGYRGAVVACLERLLRQAEAR